MGEQLTEGVLRDALRRAVEKTSQRQVADEVGISASGLGKMLAGTRRMYGPTSRRVTAWYRLREARGELERAPEPQAVAAAVRILSRQLGAHTRAELASVIAEAWAGHPGAGEAATAARLGATQGGPADPAQVMLPL